MISVKTVHEDFVTAQERILEEAQRIINKPIDALIRKSNRLKELGFNSSKDAVLGTNLRENKSKSAELLELIARYKQKYPANKFITEEEVERLCAKYGLVFGDADKYIGDIPEKNLVEIENFRLLKEDMPERYYSYGHGYVHVTHLPDIIYGPHGFEFRRRGSFPEEIGEIERIKPAFKMVASYQDFDTSGMTMKGYRLEENLPDPIVLQPVKGGYLIVSKWGEEASDEMVVNEKMN